MNQRYELLILLLSGFCNAVLFKTFFLWCVDGKPDYGLKMKLWYATSVFDSVYHNRGVARGSITGRHPPPFPRNF